MDGVHILLDGVSQAEDDYLATPPALLDWLLGTPLDMMAFTHGHADHFQPEFVRRYAEIYQPPKLIGPQDVAAELEEYPVSTGCSKAGTVQITAIPSRHIGTQYKDIPHYSLFLRGSSTVWFMGDASPLQWQDQAKLPRPDLLIVPFAYAATESAWQITEQFGAGVVLLTHMPDREQDSAQLWPAVEGVLTEHPEYEVLIPEMGETWTID